VMPKYKIINKSGCRQSFIKVRTILRDVKKVR
jgi:hypothetical protein